MDRFVFAPVEVFMDKRLSLMQIRVLGALFSFRNKDTNVVWPKRAALAERCGYSENTISKVTAQLVALGWVVKVGNGGRSAPVQYRILTPDLEAETLSDVERVADVETVAESETLSKVETLSGSATKTLSGSDRGKELTKELTNTTTTSAREKRSVKRAIPVDWQPSARCFELIVKAGITQAFAETLVDEFVLYWGERGEKRPGWDATFLNHAKAQFEKRGRQRPVASCRPPVYSSMRNTVGSQDEASQKFAEKYGHIKITRSGCVHEPG